MSKMTDDQEAWILRFNSGSAWYCKLNSVQSKRTYLPNFKRYCDWAKKNPDELIKLKVEGLQNINTEKEFQAENLLEISVNNREFAKRQEKYQNCNAEFL